METKKALDRMMAACSRRECCSSEIRAKLERLGRKKESGILPLTAAQMDEILETLCREKFIDEARYAAAFARDRSSLQGWGTNRIRRALSLKGITDTDIATALESIDEGSAASKMESLLKAKVRSLRSCDDPRSKKIKVLRYGLSRGYAYEEILECYSRITGDDTEINS